MLKNVDIRWLVCAAVALALVVVGATLLGYPGAGLVAVGGLIWLDLRESSKE